DLLRNPQIVRVREPLFFPVRLPKDCQIHAGLVSCEVFSDIVPSHQLGLCSGEVDFAMEGVMGSRQLWGFVSVVLTQFVAMTMLVMGASAAGTTTVIYSFSGGADGEYLDTDLVVDTAGNLYGTTVQGGLGSGTVFQLAPSASGWTHTVLYAFTGGADGAEPYKGVTLDAHGNLYGTAVTGGSGSCEGGCGVI